MFAHKSLQCVFYTIYFGSPFVCAAHSFRFRLFSFSPLSLLVPFFCAHTSKRKTKPTNEWTNEPQPKEEKNNKFTLKFRNFAKYTRGWESQQFRFFFFFSFLVPFSLVCCISASRLWPHLCLIRSTCMWVVGKHSKLQIHFTLARPSALSTRSVTIINLLLILFADGHWSIADQTEWFYNMR